MEEQKENPYGNKGRIEKPYAFCAGAIYKCSGIFVFGKRIKPLCFHRLGNNKNINADAIFAVYPFTPQPIITQALLLAADIPVFTE